MKIFLKHIAAFMIAVTLFTVTGITVLYHTCGKTGATTATLLATTSECICDKDAKALHENDDCCSVSHVEAKDKFDNKDCCDDRLERYAINNSFMTTVFKYIPELKIEKAELFAYFDEIVNMEEVKSYLDKAKSRYIAVRTFLIRFIHIFSNSKESPAITS